MPHTPPWILLVDDSEDDALLIRRAFKQADIPNPIHSVKSAEQAIAYLTRDIPFSDPAAFPLPKLVLLDLGMPGMDGFEFLKWLRLEPMLESLPVVVLTSSTDIKAADKAYKLGANSFLVKPNSPAELAELAESIREYWDHPNLTPQGRFAPSLRHSIIRPGGYIPPRH